jgi:hypothetical protein
MGGHFLYFTEEISPARQLLKGRQPGAPGEHLRAPQKTMKKQQKIKKKSHKKIETEQRDSRPKFIPENDTETLDLAPQHPLGIESQGEFVTEAHKD